MFQLIIITDRYCNVQRMILLSIKVQGISATKIFTNVYTDAPMIACSNTFHSVLSFALCPDAWSSSSVARFILTEKYICF